MIKGSVLGPEQLSRATWRKSNYSDVKNPTGPALTFTPTEQVIAVVDRFGQGDQVSQGAAEQGGGRVLAPQKEDAEPGQAPDAV